MPTTTTTYSFNKPVVGADEDNWGGYLNGNWDSVDDLLDGTTPVTGIDINSGTIDNVVIGGTTAAAITGTTGQFNTSLNVDGTITSDGLTVDGNATINDNFPYILLNESDTTDLNTRISVGSGYFNLNTLDDAYTAAKQRFRLDNSTGDISFYEDTGTTAKFFWDASAESLGIGTSSPAFVIDAYHATDNGLARFSSGDADAYITISDVNSSSAYNKIGVITHDMYFNTNNAERMRIDSSGHVGIGTTSPTTPLAVHGDAGVVIKIDGDTANTSRTLLFRSVGTGEGIVQTDGNMHFLQEDASRYMRFSTANTERMRIDSSGNLLVGTTSTGAASGGSGTSGININASGAIEVARSANPVVFVNRTTSDGDIMQFRKDGTTVGSIGTGSGDLNINGPAGHSGIRFQASSILPRYDGADTDGTMDLGYHDGIDTHRWRDLYLSGGVYLGGTGAANYLDDYEEGSYDVTLTCTSGTITVAGAYNNIAYTKIGRTVHIQGRLIIGSVSSPSGNVRINLPFTPDNLAEQSSYAAFEAHLYGVDLPTGTVSTFWETAGGTSTALLIYTLDNAGWADLPASGISASDILYIKGSYIST